MLVLAACFTCKRRHCVLDSVWIENNRISHVSFRLPRILLLVVCVVITMSHALTLKRHSLYCKNFDLILLSFAIFFFHFISFADPIFFFANDVDNWVNEQQLWNGCTIKIISYSYCNRKLQFNTHERSENEKAEERARVRAEEWEGESEWARNNELCLRHDYPDLILAKSKWITHEHNFQIRNMRCWHPIKSILFRFAFNRLDD